MTDAHDFDELASAHLDGTTSPEEDALVAADPALLARVEELRAIREAVASVPAVDPDRREAAIGAALAAFDDDHTASDHPVAPVTPLAPRRGLSPTATRALSVAAVLLLVALLVPLLTSIGDEASKTFDATGDAISGADQESAGDGSTAGAEDTAEEPLTEPESSPAVGAIGGVAHLGAFDDVDALAAHLASESAPDVSNRDSFDASTSLSCPVDPEAELVATADLAGDPVIVVVRLADDGARTMFVLDRATCERLVERPL